MAYRKRRRRNRKLSDFRVAWARVLSLKMFVYHYPLGELKEIRESVQAAGLDETEPETEGWEPGPDDATVYLSLEGERGQSISINLTMMTWEELVAFQSAFNIATTLAAPAVRARDKRAKDEYEQGESGNSRVYRALPEFVVRERIFGGYGQGLPVGPGDALRGNIMPEHIAERLAYLRSQVAQREQDEAFTSDGGAPFIEPESVLDLDGEEDDSPGGLPAPDSPSRTTSLTAGWND